MPTITQPKPAATPVGKRAERQLAARLAADVAAGFPDLIAAHQDGIFSGVLRMVPTRADAEDLVQETFIRAYRALLDYDTNRIRDLEVRPWLWTIAINLCRNAARQRKRRADTVPLTAEDRATVDAVDVAAEGIEAMIAAEWHRRLDTLTPSQRDSIILRHVVGLPYAEIAAVLHRPVGTTKADVHRGLEHLRNLLATETEETP